MIDAPSRGDNWAEALIDLLHVASFIKLGNRLLACNLSEHELLYQISHLIGIQMAKFELDQYHNKFGAKDLYYFFFVVNISLFHSN